MKWKIYNMQAEEVGDFQLNEEIFGGEISQPILREVVLNHQGNLRQGTSSTKSRGEVSGGGRKPWIQKGTGRARAGSIRSPLWVGGGIAFGPKPRNFRWSLPKKKKRLALKSSLRMKIKEEHFFVLDRFKVNEGKTKEVVAFLNNFSTRGKTLILLDSIDEKVRRACANLKDVEVGFISKVSGYDVLTHNNLFLTKSSVDKLTERLKNE